MYVPIDELIRRRVYSNGWAGNLAIKSLLIITLVRVLQLV